MQTPSSLLSLGHEGQLSRWAPRDHSRGPAEDAQNAPACCATLSGANNCVLIFEVAAQSLVPIPPVRRRDQTARSAAE